MILPESDMGLNIDLFQEQGDVPRVRDPAAAAGLRGQDRVRHRQRTQSHPPLQLRIHLQV